MNRRRERKWKPGLTSFKGMCERGTETSEMQVLQMTHHHRACNCIKMYSLQNMNRKSSHPASDLNYHVLSSGAGCTLLSLNILPKLHKHDPLDSWRTHSPALLIGQLLDFYLPPWKKKNAPGWEDVVIILHSNSPCTTTVFLLPVTFVISTHLPPLAHGPPVV